MNTFKKITLNNYPYQHDVHHHYYDRQYRGRKAGSRRPVLMQR